MLFVQRQSEVFSTKSNSEHNHVVPRKLYLSLADIGQTSIFHLQPNYGLLEEIQFERRFTNIISSKCSRLQTHHRLDSFLNVM